MTYKNKNLKEEFHIRLLMKMKAHQNAEFSSALGSSCGFYETERIFRGRGKNFADHYEVFLKVKCTIQDALQATPTLPPNFSSYGQREIDTSASHCPVPLAAHAKTTRRSFQHSCMDL